MKIEAPPTGAVKAPAEKTADIPAATTGAKPVATVDASKAKNRFADWYKAGYTWLLPIVPPGATPSEKSSLKKRRDKLGKIPGFRNSDGTWRGVNLLEVHSDESNLEPWSAMNAGVGVRTGVDPRTGQGVVAVDIDVLDPTFAERVEQIALDILGNAPVRIGQAPKRLLLYRVQGDEIPYTSIEFGESGPGGKSHLVELLSAKNQFVADGIHAGTLKPYEWPREKLLFKNLTLVTQKGVDDFFAELRRVLPAARKPDVQSLSGDRQRPETLKGDLEHVRKAVDALPNTRSLYPDRKDYIRVLAAIKGALQDCPDEGLALAQDWAERYDGANPADADTVASDWRRLGDTFSLGADWLYREAERHGAPGAFSRAGVFFDVLPDLPAAESSPFGTQAARAIVATGSGQRRKFNFRPLSSLADEALAEPVPSLIEGVLDQGALSIFYGPSSEGKSFVVLDLAFHIAAGLPWAGRETTPTPVLYIACEGGGGIKKRAAALRQKFGAETFDKAPFVVESAAVDLYSPDGDVGPLIEAVQETGVSSGLIVIDTVSRALAGGDENSPADMGRFVRNLARLQHETCAHVLGIHHTGKDENKGARGHSSLKAAVDTEIKIVDKQITVTKQRDHDTGLAINFVLETRQLGLDAKERAVTSATVRFDKISNQAQAQGSERRADGAPEPSDAEAKTLEALQTLCAKTDGVSGVTRDELVRLMALERADKMSKPELEKRKNNVSKQLAALRVKGLATTGKKGRWFAAKPASDAKIGVAEVNSPICESGPVFLPENALVNYEIEELRRLFH